MNSEEFVMEACNDCIHRNVCGYAQMVNELADTTPIGLTDATCAEYLSDGEDAGGYRGDAGNDLPNMMSYNDEQPDGVERETDGSLYGALLAAASVVLEQGFKPTGVMMNTEMAEDMLEELGMPAHLKNVGAMLSKINTPHGELKVMIDDSLDYEELYIVTALRKEGK